MYVQKYFKEESKKTALEMVTDIRREFDTILNEIDWMDEVTRSRAKKKADGIVEHIGYPSELLEVKKLEDLYVGLELNSTHYLGNALNITFFATSYAFSKLRERVCDINLKINVTNSKSFLFCYYSFSSPNLFLSYRLIKPIGFATEGQQL